LRKFPQKALNGRGALTINVERNVNGLRKPIELRLALIALVFPLCVLAVLIVIDLFRPFEG
jgi:hypothetical protein